MGLEDAGVLAGCVAFSSPSCIARAATFGIARAMELCQGAEDNDDVSGLLQPLGCSRDWHSKECKRGSSRETASASSAPAVQNQSSQAAPCHEVGFVVTSFADPVAAVGVARSLKSCRAQHPAKYQRPLLQDT